MRGTRRQRRLPQVNDFHEKLLEKGREKRLALVEAEAPSTGDRRNDLIPKIEIVYLAVDKPSAS